MVDFEPPAIVFTPSGPFKAIGFEVQGYSSLRQFGLATVEDTDRLSEFARDAMRARLEELGVVDRVHIIVPPHPLSSGLPPAGVSRCEVLRVTFDFRSERKEFDGVNVIVLAVSLLGTQQSAENADENLKCPDRYNLPPWALVLGPRLIVMQDPDGSSILDQSREHILSFIDFAIVPRILDANEDAQARVDSWTKPRN